MDWTDVRQQIDGFGGGVVFLNDGSALNNSNADTLFRTNTPNQLGLTLLRVRIEPNNNWSNSVSGWNGSVNEARLANARGAGVLASPWTPPAGMKTSTNTVGGSLRVEHYRSYALYLEKYASNMLANGVSLRAVSLQNEPDWDPDYEGCVWTGTQFRNFFHTNAGVIRSAPVMMPESLGFNFSLSDPSLNDPIAVTNIALVGGHLYGFPNIVPYNNAFNKGKRVWQTEFLINDQSMETSIQTARQIHDCLTAGEMSAYIWWKCLGNINGLLNASGVVQRRGYVMAQFSRFVRPGDFRIGEANSGSGAVSGYRNLADGRFAIIAINSHGLPLQQTIHLSNFPALVRLNPSITSASQSLAALPAFDVTNGTFVCTIPPNSIITFSGVAIFGPPGMASHPSPADGAGGVPVGTPLSWTPGSNTLTHAVYIGVDSNAVAAATTGSAEFQGLFSTANFTPSLSGGVAYFWRVDEIAAGQTNKGPVWSFSAVWPPPLAHRYSFNEAAGSTVADLAGGSAWNGTLQNSGMWTGGALAIGSGAQQHVTLPDGIVAGLEDFTIETWVRLNALANWTRIFDFGADSTVNMFLTPQNGSTSRPRFAITTSGAGGEQRITAPSALSTGVWQHVAITLSADVGTLYVNGSPVATNSSMTLAPASLGSTANNYLGRSQYNDPYLNGAFDEFRIYRVALSSSEIAATFALGPDELLSDENPPLSFSREPQGLAISWPLASAGFRVQSRTNLVEGTWMNVPALPHISGGQWRVTLPATSDEGAVFYRVTKDIPHGTTGQN